MYVHTLHFLLERNQPDQTLPGPHEIPPPPPKKNPRHHQAFAWFAPWHVNMHIWSHDSPSSMRPMSQYERRESNIRAWYVRHRIRRKAVDSIASVCIVRSMYETNICMNQSSWLICCPPRCTSVCKMDRIRMQCTLIEQNVSHPGRLSFTSVTACWTAFRWHSVKECSGW